MLDFQSIEKNSFEFVNFPLGLRKNMGFMADAMTYFRNILIKNILFLSIAAGTAIALLEPLVRIFCHNLPLNLVILFCLGIGIVLNFSQFLKLRKDQILLENHDSSLEDASKHQKTHVLAPLIILLNDPQYQQGLPTLTAQVVLNSVEGRLQESRSSQRYLMGVLVFLGLLGTFWGLSETIGAIAGVIHNLNTDTVEMSQAFSQLKQGLNSPLSGMGIAFSSSLFGLSGSLILGFLDLQTGRAHAQFYHQLEERLIGVTRPASLQEKTSQYNGPAYSLGLLEQTIESLSGVQTSLHRSEENRLSLVKTVQVLTEKLTQMAEQMVAHQAVIKTITHNQMELQEGFKQWIKHQHATSQEEANHLRSLDATASKLLEEIVEGRNRMTQELRQEIRVITRTLSAIADGQDIVAA